MLRWRGSPSPRKEGPIVYGLVLLDEKGSVASMTVISPGHGPSARMLTLELHRNTGWLSSIDSIQGLLNHLMQLGVSVSDSAWIVRFPMHAGASTDRVMLLLRKACGRPLEIMQSESGFDPLNRERFSSSGWTKAIGHIMEGRLSPWGTLWKPSGFRSFHPAYCSDELQLREPYITSLSIAGGDRCCFPCWSMTLICVVFPRVFASLEASRARGAPFRASNNKVPYSSTTFGSSGVALDPFLH